MNPPNVPGASNLPPPQSIPPSGGTPPPNMPPPAKPSGGMFSGRNIIIGLIALVLLCVCGCGGLFVLTGGAIGTIFTQVAAPTAVGVQFLTNMEAGDYAKAYALCTPALQGVLGSPAGLGKRISDAHAQPTSWSFGNSNLNNDRLELSGTGTFSGGRSGTVSLVIVKAGSEWKVDGFNLTPQ
jgi:hypothetical protein